MAMVCKRPTGSCRVQCPLLLKYLRPRQLMRLLLPLYLVVGAPLHLSRRPIPTVLPVIASRSLLHLIMGLWWMPGGGRPHVSHPEISAEGLCQFYYSY